MKTIYLISCCKEKLSHPAKAVDLYQSEGFKRRLSIAQTHNPDAILILSAKHHQTSGKPSTLNYEKRNRFKKGSKKESSYRL